MKQKLKTIILAFAGLIVYSALRTVTSMMTDSVIKATLIADIACILLGGAYMATVLKDFGPEVNANRINPKFLIASLLTVVLYSITSAYTSNYILNHISDTGFAAQQTDDAKSMLYIVLISVFLAPVVEELVFRGFMYRFLSTGNKLAAALISSLIFALYHGTIVHMYAAFFGGLLFCFIFERTKKLRYNIASHITFNGATVLLSFIPYFDFMKSLWFVLLLNCVTIAAVVLIWRIQPEIIVPKKVLTEDQKQERERIAKIVDEVMAERKSGR